MYKPNFCAECGERIVREHWHIWTDRKFCEECARRFRRARLALPLILCLAVFGIGLIFGRAGRPATPPLIVERGNLSPLTPAQQRDNTEAASTTSAKPEPSYGPSGTATEKPTDPTEIVSICGARTQRGTPCQRRVRGTGRCWQHRGLPAMLPPQKLIVNDLSR